MEEFELPDVIDLSEPVGSRDRRGRAVRRAAWIAGPGLLVAAIALIAHSLIRGGGPSGDKAIPLPGQETRTISASASTPVALPSATSTAPSASPSGFQSSPTGPSSGSGNGGGPGGTGSIGGSGGTGGTGGSGTIGGPPPVPTPSGNAPSPRQTGYIEEAYNRNGVPTLSNPDHASGPGAKIAFQQDVSVSCKLYDPSIPSVSPSGYWYRIASDPWHDAYYAAANTFLNGDPPGGPYSHTVDSSVPDC